MNRLRPANNRPLEPETFTHSDEIGFALRRHVTSKTAEVSASERWERLTQRIIAYQHLEALIAHTSAYGYGLRRSTLSLRPWSLLAVPIV